MTQTKTALISTLSPKMGGGVYTHQQLICQLLREKGITPIIAHYEPYPFNPQLSVRAQQILFKKNRSQQYTQNGLSAYAIGAYLPELEFTYHWLTKPWETLIDHADYHIAVSGNVLPALPFYQASIPYLTFNSTTYWADRANRIQTHSHLRKYFDAICIKPLSEHYEKKIIRHGNIMMLSHYAEKAFRPLGLPNNHTCDIIPIAVDTEHFYPRSETVVPWRIGFVGRLSDPRKNIILLLNTIQQLKMIYPKIQLYLTSGQLDPNSQAYLQNNQLRESVTIFPTRSHHELADFYRTLDVFVIPSYQEGFCIAGLEALASGCPIVSTRCGGPEEYVIDAQTGYLTESTPEALAEKIERICRDRKHRAMMSHNAIQLVQSTYIKTRVRTLFWTHFERVFQSPMF